MESAHHNAVSSGGMLVNNLWRAKKKITGGKGDIPEGTLLILERKDACHMVFRRAGMLPEGPSVQNRIIMHLPPLWEKFLELVGTTEPETADGGKMV